MSSVSSPAALRAVGTADRLLHPLGRRADDDSSGAAFAVKPAIASQDPEPDAPAPIDEVIVTVDADGAAADASLQAAETAAAALATAEAVQSELPGIDAANETIAPAPTTYSGTPAAQAAYAYAQTMQAWLDAKTPRVLAARRAPKPDGRTDR